VRDLLIIIISGLSGSGKSYTIKCFEDLGFYCVDNLPSRLVPTFVELCTHSGEEISRVALGIDIREREFLGDFLAIFEKLKSQGLKIEMLFLEARDEILLRRFSETRRPHPLAKGKPVIEGIQIERNSLNELRMRADQIIDTSDYSVHQLKAFISQHFIDIAELKPIHITLVSFGYKYGVPYDSELLFDLRFLPNPNFVPEIKAFTGNDQRVWEYMMKYPETIQFYQKLVDFLDYLIPCYEKEKRSYLNVGMGCTGGRHRSVAFVNQVGKYLRKKGLDISVRHRDIQQ
jgi:UPF0042 nucleotide-binding protein